MNMLALLALAASFLQAQESASFLKIGNGARALGLGGAYTAISNDVTALSWNPGGLGQVSRKELGGMHAELVGGTRYDFLGYAQPLRYGTLAAGIAYLGQPAIDSRDASGRLNGSYGASDSAITLGFGTAIRANALGANLKYVRSSIAGVTGQTMAFDLGAQRSLAALGPGTPSLGLAVLNLGPGLKMLGQSSPLPLALAAGLGYRLPFGLLFALDCKYHPNTETASVSFGTEYAIFSGVALRTGYASSHGVITGSSKAQDLAGLAAGFSVRFLGYNLDYSLSPFGSLGATQRLGFGVRFGAQQGPAPQKSSLETQWAK